MGLQVKFRESGLVVSKSAVLARTIHWLFSRRDGTPKPTVDKPISAGRLQGAKPHIVLHGFPPPIVDVQV